MKELKTILNQKSFADELNNKLKNGGVIAFVTDTVWGIGCLPTSEKGVNKIYEIKSRDRSKPLILMSNDINHLTQYIKQPNEYVDKLAEEYFPGALTIVAEKSEKTQNYITSGKNTVGIRVPDNEFFKILCSKIEGNVLATTSANLSNCPSSKTYEQALNSIGKFVDYTFEDYGFVCKGLESTVILSEKSSFKILRQGAVII